MVMGNGDLKKLSREGGRKKKDSIGKMLLLASKQLCGDE